MLHGNMRLGRFNEQSYVAPKIDIDRRRHSAGILFVDDPVNAYGIVEHPVGVHREGADSEGDRAVKVGFPGKGR